MREVTIVVCSNIKAFIWLKSNQTSSVEMLHMNIKLFVKYFFDLEPKLIPLGIRKHGYIRILL
jgi:hypothetical protein